MSRNILLIEPNFKNKYPPIGLMKISTYHKMLGDNVQFYKGDLKAFEFLIRLSYTIEVLQNVLPEFNWFDIEKEIKACISSKRLKLLDGIVERFEDNLDLIRSTLKPCATNKLNHTFDRIYVSTLLDGKKKTIELTKTHSEDQLILRGFLQCPKCTPMLTGSASKGRVGYIPTTTVPPAVAYA